MLGRKAALGGLLMVTARLITRLIDLGTMLVLARILAPTDFGLVAIAVSFMAIVEAAFEMPLNQALMRLPTITAAQYDTAFTLGLLRGLVLAAVLLAASSGFASFYADARLWALVCVLAAAPLARGLISPRLAEYQKEMNFWRDFAIELASKLFAFAAAIMTVLATGTYWAIATSVVALPVAVTVGSYLLAPYRPRLTLVELKLFTGFIGWLSLAQIIGAMNWQIERLLVGKLSTTAQLGLFAAASDLANIPFMAFFGPVLRPLLAAFAKLQGTPERLGYSYLQASGAVVAIGLPLLVGESLVADPAVRVVLGTKWLAAVPLVKWLSLSLIPALPVLPAGPLFMSVGRTRMFLTRNALEFGVKLPATVVGAVYFGFPGIIAARFLSEFAAGAYSLAMVRRFTGLTAWHQLRLCWRSALATLAMVPPVLLCLHLLQGEGIGHAIAGLLGAGAVGAAVYATAMWLLWVASGRPSGIEEMATEAIARGLGRLALKRLRPAVLPRDRGTA